MTNKIALLAAAASLTFAGAAFAQSTTTTTTPASPTTGAMPPASTTMPAPTQSTTTMTPAQSTTTTMTPSGSTTTQTTTPPSANPADAAGTPTSASVASFKVGSAVKDAGGVSVGQITGTSTGADGSTNVIVANGGVKFALPANSLSAGADGSVSTTATKAQIDATVAGAKPQ
ncbi:hypothetical protein [Caulobacter sp. FWC2]|uniref:hypothetical protein n=1 Tax=Caulobacter sp. FWC2 TaxID=69664 RepID=UPI000C14A9E0|nr:hypothetical protein [Caulobacter sp. FWC2]PIB93576.1 hypothetical protein CSW62_19565 [Caulobacter sp. FWC2]